MAIKLLYDNVEGELVAAGRPAGFALVNADGGKVPGIFKATLEGSTVTLHTDKSEKQLKSPGVSYGHGRHPYCNIADRDGMSLPAMQRVMITLDGAE